MPSANRELGLLGSELNGRHLDNDLQPGVLEPVTKRVLDLVRHWLKVQRLWEHRISEFLPFQFRNVSCLLHFVAHQLACLLVNLCIYLFVHPLHFVFIVGCWAVVPFVCSENVGVEFLPYVVRVILTEQPESANGLLCGETATYVVMYSLDRWRQTKPLLNFGTIASDRFAAEHSIPGRNSRVNNLFN